MKQIDQDIGIMELLPEVTKARGVPDPFNPRQTDVRSMMMGAKSGVITENVLRAMEANFQAAGNQ